VSFVPDHYYGQLHPLFLLWWLLWNNTSQFIDSVLSKQCLDRFRAPIIQHSLLFDDTPPYSYLHATPPFSPVVPLQFLIVVSSTSTLSTRHFHIGLSQSILKRSRSFHDGQPQRSFYFPGVLPFLPQELTLAQSNTRHANKQYPCREDVRRNRNGKSKTNIHWYSSTKPPRESKFSTSTFRNIATIHISLPKYFFPLFHSCSVVTNSPLYFFIELVRYHVAICA